MVTGVEYIIDDDIYETLPPEEQKLWHSHAYEVFELQLIATCAFIWLNCMCSFDCRKMLRDG